MDHDEPPRLFTGRLELIAATPTGFGSWQIVAVGAGTAVGSVALSPPDGDGAVEIALDVDHKRHGLVAEALGGLIDWAFSHDGVRCIRAHAAAAASAIRLFVDNGLAHVGDDGARLCFELRRP